MSHLTEFRSVNTRRKKVRETLYSIFDQSWDIWTSWRLFNIIVIICDIDFETLLYISKLYRTLVHFLTFGTSQIITIISNNHQLVYMSQFSSKVEWSFFNYFSPCTFGEWKLNQPWKGQFSRRNEIFLVFMYTSRYHAQKTQIV